MLSRYQTDALSECSSCLNCGSGTVCLFFNLTLDVWMQYLFCAVFYWVPCSLCFYCKLCVHSETQRKLQVVCSVSVILDWYVKLMTRNEKAGVRLLKHRTYWMIGLFTRSYRWVSMAVGFHAGRHDGVIGYADDLVLVSVTLRHLRITQSGP